MRTRAWLAILAVLCLAGCGDLHTRCAEARHPPVGQFIQVQGLRTHYLDEGQGPPVVFIHGSFGSVYDLVYSPLRDELRRHYRVIAYDRPGHGYTRRPPRARLTPQEHAHFLHALLAQLRLPQKPLLIGHSWGSAVALAYALRYPQDTCGLVLLGPIAYPDLPWISPPSLLRQKWITDEWFVQTLLQPLLAVGLPLGQHLAFAPQDPPAGYAQTWADLGRRPAVYRAEIRDDRILKPQLRRMSACYGSIRVPVAILVGSEDRTVDPNEHAYPLHFAIPTSHLMMAWGSGHQVAFTRPDLVMYALRWTAERGRCAVPMLAAGQPARQDGVSAAAPDQFARRPAPF